MNVVFRRIDIVTEETRSVSRSGTFGSVILCQKRVTPHSLHVFTRLVKLRLNSQVTLLESFGISDVLVDPPFGVS